jgi:kynurenine formamidase
MNSKDQTTSSQECLPCSTPSIFSFSFPSEEHNTYDIYDLSYSLNEGMNVWPGKPPIFCIIGIVYVNVFFFCFAGDQPFQHCVSCHPDYTSGSFSISEHCGTHVDAPYHFVKDGLPVDRIPLSQLITSVKVIDIRDACLGNPDYQLSKNDVESFETKYGNLIPSDILFIRTGWHIHWKDGNSAYYGMTEDSSAAASVLSFPGISVDAAELLVERGIKGVGLDAPSLDYGKTLDFAVHRLLLGNGMIGVENLNEQIVNLPPKGAIVMIMPLKIVGGSGSPARIIAFVPK